MSSLSKYIGATQQHAEELQQALTEADLAALHQDLAALGKHGWLKWSAEHRNQIADFLQATPTVRSRRKAWQNQSLRLRLSYGAILYAQESGIVLTVLHQSSCIEAESMLGYRNMTASASELFYEMAYQLRSRHQWPFPERDPPF